jgi:hypothetical protein
MSEMEKPWKALSDLGQVRAKEGGGRMALATWVKMPVEQQLGILERDVAPLIEAVCAAFTPDPGVSASHTFTPWVVARRRV